MTDRLRLYNRALEICGESSLASLSEERAARRHLDDVWDGNFVKSALEAGLWNFAMRARMASPNPSIEPDFGFQHAFDKPSDWVRTAGISDDEYFTDPLTRYEDEANFWFADCDPLYVRYVSDDPSFGADLSRWPESFAKYAAHELAIRIAPRLTASDGKIERIEKALKKAGIDARSKDAMNQAPGMFPRGAWVRARRGGGNRERGNRGSLYG